MRLIFLDIDGVLNSKNWFDQNPRPARKRMDPRCVSLVNQIGIETGARVVVTANLRKSIWPNHLMGLLKKEGLAPEMVGVTPWTDDTGIQAFDDRGAEIAEWLRKNWTGMNVESFVILDDKDDMGELRNFLVQTDPQIGISDVDVRGALDILTSEGDQCLRFLKKNAQLSSTLSGRLSSLPSGKPVS